MAFPLIVTGVAQASIAGALPASTSGPNLRSATILSSTTVEVCYNKTLNSTYETGRSGDFALYGYRSDNESVTNSGAAVDPTNTNCLIVTFVAGSAPSGIGDMTQYTVLTDFGSGAESNTSTALSLEDSVTLTGSTTHAGTTGVSTGPNLVGIQTPTGTNLTTHTLTYVFDKQVSGTFDATKFFFIDGAGNTCPGTSILSSPAGSTNVTVTFTPCGASDVGSAVRGGVKLGGVHSYSDSTSINPNESVILPSAPSGGATQRADLVSAALATGNADAVTYTFDKPVIVDTSSDFIVELSDGTTRAASGCTGGGGTTVTCSFGGNLSFQDEYAVIAWVYGGTTAGTSAVSNADAPTTFGTPGSAPIGDNAGAFGRGFTTGADVFGISISGGVITVNVDQRVTFVDMTDITLLTATGATVTATGTPAFNSSAPAGPETITLTYPASALTNVTQVQFGFDAFQTPANLTIDTDDEFSIPQIVNTVNSAAILKAYKHHVAKLKHTKHSKKHHTHTKKV